MTKRNPTKNRGGGPPKFSSVDDLEVAVEKHFASTEQSQKPPTIAGLMRELDFADYSIFHDYKAKPRFSQALKKARLRILEAHEGRLFSPSCTGSIFYLKCHGGGMVKERPKLHEHSGPRGGTIDIEIDWTEPSRN
ncbi:MAG: terminase small subunit [Geminicoccales bacterium]